MKYESSTILPSKNTRNIEDIVQHCIIDRLLVVNNNANAKLIGDDNNNWSVINAEDNNNNINSLSSENNDNNNDK